MDNDGVSGRAFLWLCVAVILLAIAQILHSAREMIQ